MNNNRKTYVVSQVKQLIDLNGSSTNFDISFKVTSRNREPFQVLVVDQTTLDNSPQLEYKDVTTGEISGNLRNDKNVYQNYFLVLRSNVQCECDVEINKEELPKTQIQPPPVIAPPPKPNSFSWIKTILILAVIGAIAFGLYWYTYKRKQTAEDKNVITPSYVPTFDFKSSSRHSSVAKSESPENPILQKLKGLKMDR